MPKAQSAQIPRVCHPRPVYISVAPHPSGHLGQDRGDVDELGEAELRRRVGFQGRDDFVHRELGHVDAELQEAEEVGADDEASPRGRTPRSTSSLQFRRVKDLEAGSVHVLRAAVSHVRHGLGHHGFRVQES